MMGGMKKIGLSILYLLCLFLYIISKNAVYLAFTREAIYYPVVLEPYINTAILLLICIMLCLTAGKFIGREVTKKIKAKSLFTMFIAIILTAAQLYFLIEKAWYLDTEPFYLVVSLYLIAFSWKQDFKGIVAAYTAAHAVVLMTAVLGLFLGYTEDAVKFTDYGAKHAFGLVHPNTAGRVIFAIVAGTWFLFLRKKRGWTFVLFWLTAAVLLIWNRCRTVIIMMILLPVSLLLVDGQKRHGKRVLKSLLCAAPFLCFGITLFSCIPIHLVHRLTYQTPLFSIGERIVQSGIALRSYGLPLIGHSIDTSGAIRMMVDGEKISLFVMDNAYVSYGIILGLLWLIPALLFLCAANRKAWNGRNLDLLVYGLFLVVFAFMERRGLDPAYNLMFFYPLSINLGRVRHDARAA